MDTAPGGSPEVARPDDRPRSMRDPRVRAEGRGGVPFLFEKPGPMADGPGFISRDNDDGTAEAAHRSFREAGLLRAATATWNLVPWRNGTIAVTAAECASGGERLRDLPAPLPGLRAAVLVGRRAERGAGHLLRRAGLAVFASLRPSPRKRASRRERWEAIPRVWAQAAAGEAQEGDPRRATARA